MFDSRIKRITEPKSPNYILGIRMIPETEPNTQYVGLFTVKQVIGFIAIQITEE